MSAAGGQHLARLTLDVLQSIRKPDRFSGFYKLVLIAKDHFSIADPALPRKRRAPKQFEVGSSSGSFHQTPEDHYWQIYFEALDYAIQPIHDRFNQPGYGTYQNLEQLILKACKGKPYNAELAFVCDFYKEDLSNNQLNAQLPLLQHLFQASVETSAKKPDDMCVAEVVSALGKLPTAEKVAFSEVFTVMKLLLLMPASNATSERSFSALRRIKTYLRSTMTQQRLNNLMVLHVHKT